MKKKLFCLLLVFVLVASMLSGCAEKAYPSKAIDLVCAGSAGSGGDVLLRLIASYLGTELGVTVNVVNTPGGGGIPAVQSVLDSQHDGYTLMGDQGLSSSFQTTLDEVPYDIFADRKYICKIASGPQVLCGSPNMGWEDIRDVAEYMKSNPDEEFIWGGIGKNSAANFAALEFFTESGIDVAKTTELRYGGGGEILAAIAGGHILLGSSAASGVPSFAQDGSVKPLVVCGSSRLDILPDVPCAAELGFTTLNADFWIGLSGPADMPDEAVKALDAAVQKIIANEEFQADIGKIGAVLNYVSGAEFEAVLQAEASMVQELVKLGTD